MGKEMKTEKDLSIYKIPDPWFSQFVGRQIKSDYIEEITSPIYLNYDFDPILSAEFSTNTNHQITGISLRKYQDNSPAHGRPQIREQTITQHDRLKVIDYLNEVTIPRFTLEQLNKIVGKAKSYDNDLIIKINKNTISFASHNDSIRISNKKLLEYLEISCTYIDILYNDDFWVANNYLNPNHKNLVMLLSNYIDKTIYNDYNNLLKQAAHRTHLALAKIKYRELCEQIKSHTFSNDSYLLSFAKEAICSIDCNAMEEAIRINDASIIQLLFDNKAYINSNCLLAAMYRNDLSLFNKLINHINDINILNDIVDLTIAEKKYSYLIALANHGAAIRSNSNFPIEILCKLSEAKNIHWDENSIIILYQNNKIDELKEILHNISEIKSDPIKIENYYGEYSYYAIISHIIKTKDIQNIRYVLNTFYDITPSLINYIIEQKIFGCNEMQIEVICEALSINAPTYDKYFNKEESSYTANSNFCNLVSFISANGKTETAGVYKYATPDNHALKFLISLYPQLLDDYNCTKCIVNSKINMENWDNKVIEACKLTYAKQYKEKAMQSFDNFDYHYDRIPNTFTDALKWDYEFIKKTLEFLHLKEDNYEQFIDISSTIIYNIKHCNIHCDKDINNGLEYILNYIETQKHKINPLSYINDDINWDIENTTNIINELLKK